MSTSNRHILLVENNEVLAEVTTFRLELLGYRVSAVRTAVEAAGMLARAEEPLPDVLVIDLELPDMSGLDLIEQVTWDERTAAIPIMAVSEDGDLDLVASAYRAGASDFLVAPYNPLVLEEKIARLAQMTRTSATVDGKTRVSGRRWPAPSRN